MAILTDTLQHATSCFSLLTYCENSVYASKATDREKNIGASSLYNTMNEKSSSEIFLFLNPLVAETLPHFFVSTLMKFFIHRDSKFKRKKSPLLEIKFSFSRITDYRYFFSNP